MKARRSSPCRTGQCNFSAGLFNQRPDFLETGSAQFTQCLATRPQPIRDDRIRSGVALHQFPEEFQGGLAISLIRDKGLQHLAFPVHSVVAWIGAEMEFPLSQAVASGDAFEHRPSECGHCVQNFLADLDLRDLPGEAAGFELGADDTLPTADLRFYPAALVVPCSRLPSHAAIAADLGNMTDATWNAGGGRCSGIRTTTEVSAACHFRFEGESWRRSPWPPLITGCRRDERDAGDAIQRLAGARTERRDRRQSNQQLQASRAL